MAGGWFTPDRLIGKLLPDNAGDEIHRSRMLAVITLVLLTVTTLIAVLDVVVGLVEGSVESRDLLLSVVGVPVTGVALWFNRKGSGQVAAWLVVSYLLTVALLRTYLEGHPPFDPPGATSLLLTVVVAVAVLEWRNAWLMLVITSVFYAALNILWLRGALPPPSRPPSPSLAGFVVITWITSAIIVMLIIHSLLTALRYRAEVLEQRVVERTAEITEASKQLRTLSRVKDEFLANVSHELRTPITNLKLHQYLIEKNPVKTARYLEVIRRETERLERIVEDLLQLSRLDQEQVNMRLEPININALAELCINDRVPLAEQRGLTLTFSQEPDPPLTMADKDLLGQVLSVLLTNAINYTPSGGEISVSTHTRETEGMRWVGLSVRDTGPGIPPDERPRVFERFYRGQIALKTGTPGTGLGLAIAREIMERHRGRIEVTSEDGPQQGTSFSIWLPVEGER